MKNICKTILLLSLIVLSTTTIASASAYTWPILPTDPISMTTATGTASYLSITFTDIPSGYSVNNGIYQGWCGNVMYDIGVGPYTVTLFSSQSSSLPASVASINWTQVNYILNHKQGDPMEIQEALWTIMMPGIVSPPTSHVNAWAMINDANANADPTYEPAPGDIFAVICLTNEWITSANPSSSAIQPVIIELQMPSTSTTSTLLSSSTITLGQSVTDTAIVTASATGQVNFEVSTDGTTFTVYSTKTLSGDNPSTAISDPYTPTVAGNYFFRAVYLGNLQYFNSQSGDNEEPLTVNRAPATVVTSLSATEIKLGQTIHDSATVTGLSGSEFPAPTGTVTFYVSTDATTWVQVGGIANLIGDTATSADYTPTTPGTYYFQAQYSGDSNYNSAFSEATAEMFITTKATPTVKTILSKDTITIGSSCGSSCGGSSGYGGNCGGSNYYSNCGSSGYGGSSNYGTNCGNSQSGSYYGYSNYGTSCTSSYGTYCTGGSYNTNCGTSSSTVTDTAIVTGVTGFPVPTGTITFQVSTDNGATWTNYGSVKTLVNGKATSDSYKPLFAGTYYFRAVYSGDSKYLGEQSGNTEEPLNVISYLKTTTTTTCLSSDKIKLGQSVTDIAFVTKGATGQVRFEVSTDGINFVQYGNLKTLTGSCINKATSDPYTPTATGTYYFRAIYLGDSRYSGSQSGNNEEILTVTENTCLTSGLSPGFWKNHQYLWQGNKPCDSFNKVFGVSIKIGCDKNPTLLVALKSNGGGVNALARQAVAALLNSEHQYINYPLTKSEVINLVKSAINSGDSATIESAKNLLEGYNNLGGGIDAHGNPI